MSIMTEVATPVPDVQSASLPTRVYVGNLPWSVDENRLREMFDHVGRINEVKIIYDKDTGRSKGFAFITFSTEPEAQKAFAMNGKEVSGRIIKVNSAQPPGTPARRVNELTQGYESHISPPFLPYGMIAAGSPHYSYQAFPPFGYNISPFYAQSGSSGPMPGMGHAVATPMPTQAGMVPGYGHPTLLAQGPYGGFPVPGPHTVPVPMNSGDQAVEGTGLGIPMSVPQYHYPSGRQKSIHPSTASSINDQKTVSAS